ncbi:DUF4493 domain-containing protein [Parabacteroides sp. W1-Q-101]|uniref:DUF4493 domain-containing protein n=1 Tax=Parabacteroides TaxID=375288 RepID=UPI00202DCB2F|nr:MULTISPECIES: DUF4493 domain-containing protein [Parabacteroides]MCM0716960.1 DUF4493 domain-containing protein [Parabacteroides sp. W1-Q-101]
MKRNILYCCLCAVLLGWSACGDEPENKVTGFEEGTGGLRLMAGYSTEIKVPVITRSADFSALAVKDLHIVITDNKDNSVKLDKVYGDLLNEEEGGLPIVLPLGEYTVKACTTTDTAEGVTEIPYFMAENDKVRVEEKQISNVSLRCTFESIGVELAVSDQFKQLMEEQPNNYSYQVTVSNGIVSREFTPDKMTAVYFLDACKALVVKVKVRLGASNSWYPKRTYYVKNSLNTPATSPQLGEYYVIRLDAGAEQEETLSLKSVTQEIKE